MSRYAPIPKHAGLKEMSSTATSPREDIDFLASNWMVYLKAAEIEHVIEEHTDRENSNGKHMFEI